MDRLPADGTQRSLLGRYAQVVLDAIASKAVSAWQYAPAFDDAFGLPLADGFLADGACCFAFGGSGLLL